MKNIKINSINSNLIFLFISCSLLPLLILTSIMTFLWQDKNTQILETQSSSLLYAIANNIETYTDDLKRLSLSPHSYNDIMSFFTYVKNADYDNPDDPYQQFTISRNYISTVQNLLMTARADTLGICYVPLRDNSSKFYVSSRYSDLSVLNDYPYWKESWYHEALTNNGEIIYTAASKVNYYGQYPVKTFSVVRRVRDVYTKKNIGIIKVDLTYELLEHLFDNMECTKSSFVGLIDHNGNIIYGGDHISHELALSALDSSVVSSDQDTYRIIRKTVEGTPWQLIYFSSQRDVTYQIYTNFITAFCVFIPLFGLAFALFKLRSGRITASVKTILASMKQVGKGDLNTKIDTDALYGYEFTQISSYFNLMTERLDSHIRSEYQAQIYRKTAEYRALQNQINPHFLYNTLNIFVTLNRLGYKGELEVGLIKLSNIFRYTCSNDEYCTIAQELDFVQQYLDIQKLRYEERLNFLIACDYEVQGILIPKLIVQPLVENAIKHGMEPSEKPITIKIQVQKCTLRVDQPVDYVILTVSNDGIGFDASDQRIMRSVGLSNITERLNLYHKDSFFYLRSGENQLTIASILIPFCKSKGGPQCQTNEPY